MAGTRKGRGYLRPCRVPQTLSREQLQYKATSFDTEPQEKHCFPKTNASLAGASPARACITSCPSSAPSSHFPHIFSVLLSSLYSQRFFFFFFSEQQQNLGCGFHRTATELQPLERTRDPCEPGYPKPYQAHLHFRLKGRECASDLSPNQHTC